MSLDLCPQLLKVLDDRTVDSASEVGVVISDDASFVSDVVENILKRMSNVLICQPEKKVSPEGRHRPRTGFQHGRGPE